MSAHRLGHVDPLQAVEEFGGEKLRVAVCEAGRDFVQVAIVIVERKMTKEILAGKPLRQRARDGAHQPLADESRKTCERTVAFVPYISFVTGEEFVAAVARKDDRYVLPGGFGYV
jgi:hypothetical protein